MTDEAVNHPAHYGGSGNPYEAIKVIEAWDLGFCLGNTVKYISRAGKKDSILQDLKKALWYLEREISNLESAQAVPDPDRELLQKPAGLSYFTEHGSEWVRGPAGLWYHKEVNGSWQIASMPPRNLLTEDQYRYDFFLGRPIRQSDTGSWETKEYGQWRPMTFSEQAIWDNYRKGHSGSGT